MGKNTVVWAVLAAFLALFPFGTPRAEALKASCEPRRSAYGAVVKSMRTGDLAPVRAFLATHRGGVPLRLRKYVRQVARGKFPMPLADHVKIRITNSIHPILLACSIACAAGGYALFDSLGLPAGWGLLGALLPGEVVMLLGGRAIARGKRMKAADAGHPVEKEALKLLLDNGDLPTVEQVACDANAPAGLRRFARDLLEPKPVRKPVVRFGRLNSVLRSLIF